MGKFNTATKGSKTTNLAGGVAYEQTPKVELVSHLLTSFVEDQFYRSEAEGLDRLRELLNTVDSEFAAKAAVYARNEFGMRSISHVTAAEIASSTSGEAWVKHFLNSVVRRPDDMTEILSYYMGQNSGRPLPNSMKKGLRLAFDKFDGYQLAKYRGDGKTVSLVDVVNLVHPVPTDKNSDALSKLVNGELKSTDTWEAKLTEAGKSAQTDEEKAANKKAAWAELINTRKIGYFALLRNLRNIMEQAPEVLDEALELLVDPKLIKKSLVLPFRFLTAYEEISKSGLDGTQKVLRALSKAIDISVDNVPEFDGRTLIALDSSSSMLGNWGAPTGTKAPARLGAVLMGAMLKKNPDNTDLMLFESDANYITVDAGNTTLSIIDQIVGKIGGGATNTPAVFNRANKAYDRIIIISDMQTWVENVYGYGWGSRSTSSVPVARDEYASKYGVSPHIYTMDMTGYGTANFSESQVYQLAGFSEKVFDMMKLLEQDRNALVNTIEAVKLR